MTELLWVSIGLVGGLVLGVPMGAVGIEILRVVVWPVIRKGKKND